MADYLSQLKQAQKGGDKDKEQEQEKADRKDDVKHDDSASASPSASASQKKYREPAADEWVTVEDEFVTVWGMNVSWPASDMNGGPYTHW